MTFGFANAPPCFQRYMNKVFAPLLYKNVEIYLDDMLNHHSNLPEHINGMRNMLQCLRDAKLFCNPKKCEFHQDKIKFLGVNISQNRFEMDNKKIAAVVDWQ